MRGSIYALAILCSDTTTTIQRECVIKFATLWPLIMLPLAPCCRGRHRGHKLGTQLPLLSTPLNYLNA